MKKSKNKLTPFLFRLDPEIKQKLDSYSVKTGVPIAFFIRRSIKKELSRVS